MLSLFKRFIIMSWLLLGLHSQVIAVEQITVGWIENASIDNSDFTLKCKIDSGADNSSIHAKEVTQYTNNGKQWVKFALENSQGNKTIINKPVLKTTRVKMKNGAIQKRLVIELNIALGAIKKLTKVSLVDRSHFKYQLLIGRSFLKPDFLVDSSKTYTIKN